MTAVADPIDAVIARLRGVKQASSSRWMCQCPSHNDGTASLQVTRGDDGRALVHCFAGCSTEDIMAKIGLPMGALFPDDKPVEPETIYTYHNADGSVAYQAIRIPQPNGKKDFKQRKPDGKGGWIYSLKGVMRVPYRLPDLLASDKVVWVVEGEKDADRLSLYKQTATTNNGGAGNWDEALSPHMLNRHVVILPDNDDAGHKHAQQVADSVYLFAASVRIVQLPGLPDKGDVSDWLDKGGTIEQLQDLVKAAPKWTPESAALPEPSPEQPPKWNIKPLSALTIDQEKVGWIWEGYIAPKMVTLLTGLWKAGKTSLLSYLLRSLDGLSYDFAGQAVSERLCKVLIVSEESEYLWAMRRDELSLGDHVNVLCEPFLTAPTTAIWEGLIKDIAEKVVAENYELVVFDSIHNLFAVKDETDNTQVRNAMFPMKELTKAGAAVLVLGHSGKEDKGFGKNARSASALAAFVDIMVEFRPYSADNLEDTRRVLDAKGRFRETPVQLVLHFAHGTGYTPQGTRLDAQRNARRYALQDILPTESPGATIEELLANWPEHEQKPNRHTLASDLNQLATTQPEFLREGKGTKIDPYHYWYSKQNEQWQHKSGGN